MPYIMTIVSLFVTDGIIKHLIEKSQKFDDKKCESDGKVVIKRYHNKGAMLNLGDKNQYFVALLSLVFSAFVTGMFAVTLCMKGKGLLNAGLALMLGGAYSNTYDRLKRKYVVDYISFHMDTKKCNSRFLKKLADKFSKVVFNISDFAVIIGAMLLTIGALATEKNE